MSTARIRQFSSLIGPRLQAQEIYAAMLLAWIFAVNPAKTRCSTRPCSQRVRNCRGGNRGEAKKLRVGRLCAGLDGGAFGRRTIGEYREHAAAAPRPRGRDRVGM